MKGFIVLFVMMGFTFGAYTQESSDILDIKSTTEVKKESKKQERKRTNELSLSYIFEGLSEVKYSFRGEGLELRGGKLVRLNDYFSTTSSLSYRRLSYDIYFSDLQDFREVSSHQAILSQALNYDFKLTSGILRPFFGLSVGRAFLRNSNNGFRQSYDKFGLDFGSQFVSDSGVSLSLILNRSRLIFDDFKTGQSSAAFGVGYIF